MSPSRRLGFAACCLFRAAHFGSAAWREATVAGREVVVIADEALYRAKAGGKNRVEPAREAAP